MHLATVHATIPDRTDARLGRRYDRFATVHDRYNDHANNNAGACRRAGSSV
ncbi:hypothetical protein ACRQ5Q_35785 [Bradyrhizobium sp. PMVTL-01]|uniref:hypothetical protein n=1 Tax=Bradyrhizobium sp. PMVTL-01 TaxID=3434999 RepID=UPI003F6E9EC8